jgi:hypothetical protein
VDVVGDTAVIHGINTVMQGEPIIFGNANFAEFAM